MSNKTLAWTVRANIGVCGFTHYGKPFVDNVGDLTGLSKTLDFVCR